jgi:hypothetical protein
MGRLMLAAVFILAPVLQDVVKARAERRQQEESSR